MLHRSWRSHFVQFSLVGLSLFLAPSFLWSQEDEQDLRERFLKGVAETATELEDVSFRTKVVSEFSGKEKGASETTETRIYEIAIRGTCILETGAKKDGGNTYFRVRNHDYAFALEQTGEGQQTNLQFLEQIGITPSVDARIARIEETPRMLALAGFYLWNDSLSRLVKSDSFSIKRVYGVTSGDKDLVRVEFEQRVDEPARSSNYQITDGFLVCDPAKAWALTEYGGTKCNFMNKCNSVLNVAFEYDEAIDGIPIATKTVRTMSLCYADADCTCEDVVAEDIIQDSDYRTEDVWTATIISRDVPEAEFYLTHYGLPEPNFNQGWFGAWVWYLFAGVLCLAISGLIFRRRSRNG